MIQRNKIVGALAGALVCLAAAPSIADSGHGSSRFSANLDGYQEVPLTLNSPGSGEFVARIRQNGTAIEYRLTYRDLPNVTQAHIHVGRPALNGGIALWLCNQTSVPAVPPVLPFPQPPQCQADPLATGSTITGTLTAANLVPIPGQGIATFEDVVDAFRAGAVYANIHTTLRPGGEIRGDIPGRHHRHGDDD